MKSDELPEVMSLESALMEDYNFEKEKMGMLNSKDAHQISVAQSSSLLKATLAPTSIAPPNL